MIKKNELKEYLGCDDEFLAHLMETFIKESKEGTHRLTTATSTKNWPVVKATAHKMLSSTRILNLVELSNLLEEIEKMSEKNIDVELIPSKINTVEESCKNVVEEVKAMLQEMKG